MDRRFRLPVNRTHKGYSAQWKTSKQIVPTLIACLAKKTKTKTKTNTDCGKKKKKKLYALLIAERDTTNL